MEVFGLIGMLLAFAVITFIDMPKLNATANKKKYSAVYYTVIAAGILIGVLEMFQIIPDYNKSLAFFFQKMTGIR
jgi:H+/gluconate symporter-like permease